MRDVLLVPADLAARSEVEVIAAATGRNRHEVAGLLVAFWGWLQRASTGDYFLDADDPVQLLTAQVGADAAFWEAVQATGWLVLGRASIRVRPLETWLGAGAFKRHQERLRQHEKRAQKELFPSEVNESSETPKPIKKVSGAKGSGEVDWDLFDRFWRAYPRRVAKAAAVKAFGHLNADDALVTLMVEAVKAQGLPEKFKQEPAYVPHPATWLNGKRWMDERTNGPGRAGRVAADDGKYDRVGEEIGDEETPPPA